MRDPLTWSFPLGRLFGVNLRVHVVFVLVVIGLPLREAFAKDPVPGLWVDACVLMGLLFLSVLLHEFGHCFGARAVDGDATDVLLWPLGGLNFPEVPHTPRSYLLTALAGPGVNLLLCVAACAGLAAASLLPSFAPWSDPYFPVVYQWQEQSYYGNKTGHGALWRFTAFKGDNDEWVSARDVEEDGNHNWFDRKTHKPVAPQRIHPDLVVLLPEENGKKLEEPDRYGMVTDKEKKKDPVPVKAQPLQQSLWVVPLTRVFWVNWFLLLVNLVPAFPLDGGRLLQSVGWWRTDYRQATLFAIGIGFVTLLFCIVLGIVTNETLVFGLAVFIYIACRRQWIVLETGGEESLFGYDFSEGYTSLEREQPTPPVRRRQTWWQRWLKRRAEQKMRRQQETREAEERRMDELLEKVQRVGLQGLTDEERRFLTRVSARYRNRQE